MFYAISAIIFIYSIYTAWVGSQNNDLRQCLFSGFWFIGGFGLVFKKKWSEFVLYLLAVLLVGNWLYSLWEVYKTDWPFRATSNETIITLLQGLFLIILCICACTVVHRELKRIE